MNQSNDYDLDGDALSVVSVGTAGNGYTQNNYDGTVTYSPNSGFTGYDNYTYTISDGEFSVTATVSITVNSTGPANGIPVATSETITVVYNGSATFNVLDNDSDPDSDPIVISSFTTPSNGILVDNGNGLFTYTPNASFGGSDSFTYKVSDGKDVSITTGYVTLDIQSGTLAFNDTATTQEDAPILINVVENDVDTDGDPITITSVGNAGDGSVVNNGDGTVSYSPRADFFGNDSFTYTISDGINSDTATVNITVNSVADNPTARDDYVQASAGQSITVSVLMNDFDADGETISISSFDNSLTSGTVLDNGDGSVTYTAPASLINDSFQYIISDGSLNSTATVHIKAPGKVVVSYNHMASLKADGTVWSWGENYYGQLGDNTNVSSNAPVPAYTTSDELLSNITDIGAGFWYSVALRCAMMEASGPGVITVMETGVTIQASTVMCLYKS